MQFFFVVAHIFIQASYSLVYESKKSFSAHGSGCELDEREGSTRELRPQDNASGAAPQDNASASHACA